MEHLTEQELNFLRQAIGLARQARQDGRHPFGALIVNERERPSWPRATTRCAPPATHADTQKWSPAPRLPGC